MYPPLLAMLKSASGALTMPNLNRLTALSAMSLLAAAGTALPCPYLLAAQERTQEKKTKTLEKKKPAEPTPPPKEESSVTEHSIQICRQDNPYQTIRRAHPAE